MQRVPTPANQPLTRAQKLRWYAEQLVADAVTDEKAGNFEAGVSHYLQAADIFLLLAKVEENYSAWRYYTDGASTCQQKARGLIALS
jgi:hypothetical protein